MASQRIGKYACLEVECRYLLKTIPADPFFTGGNLVMMTDEE
jgi:hypothetical protein